MSSKVYLALAGGTLFGALIIGNPFLAARAAERPAVAAPPALSSAPPIEVRPEGVNLLGQWFAVMGPQLGAARPHGAAGLGLGALLANG